MRILILVLLVSCSSKTIQKTSSGTGNPLFKEANLLIESDNGSQESRNKVKSVLEKLKKQKNAKYESLLIESWLVKRAGYIDEDRGYQNKSIKDAYGLIRKAISKNKSRWEGWRALTNLYLNARDVKRAKLAFKKYSELKLFHDDQDYQYSKSLFDLTFAFYDGNFNFVENNYKKCINKSQNKYQQKNCLHYLAMAYGKQNKPKDELEIRKDILKLLPEDAWTNGNLAGVYFVLKDDGNAIKHYEKAMSIRPYGMAKSNLSYLYAIKAHSLFKNGKKDSAKQYLEKAIAIDYFSENGALYIDTVLKQDFKDNKRAEEFLKKVESSIPSSGKIKSTLGWGELEKKNYQEALKYYKSILEKDVSRFSPVEVQIDAGLKIAFINMWRTKPKNYNEAVKYLDLIKPLVKKGSQQEAVFYRYISSSYHEKSWEEKSIDLSKKALEYYKIALAMNPSEKDRLSKNMKAVEININNFQKSK